MDRDLFIAALRRRTSGLFGTTITASQQGGITAILDEAERRKTPLMHLAYLLATAYHESAHTMQPVRETKATTDDKAIAILERAWKAGKLPWVKTPYWRKDADGKSWLGRGLVQLTHKANYDKMGKLIGIDLVADPDRAMEMAVAIKIIFTGMEQGTFTGKGFNSYIDKLDESDDLDRAEYRTGRRIINGTDKADLIAGYAISIEHALREAGYLEILEASAANATVDAPAASPAPAMLPPVRTDKTTVEVVQRKLFDLGYTEVGSRDPKTGSFDGDFGKLTRTAILAFRNENGLPLSNVIDNQLLTALDTAQPRNLPRNTATAGEVRAAAPEVQASFRTKIAAGIASAGSLILAAVNGIAGNIGAAKAYLDPLKDYAGEVPGWVWLIAIGGIAYGLYSVAAHGERKGIEAYQSGERR